MLVRGCCGVACNRVGLGCGGGCGFRPVSGLVLYV